MKISLTFFAAVVGVAIAKPGDGVYELQAGGDKGYTACTNGTASTRFDAKKTYSTKQLANGACEAFCDKQDDCVGFLLRYRTCYFLSSSSPCQPAPVNGTNAKAHFKAYYLRVGTEPPTASPTTKAPTQFPTTPLPTSRPTKSPTQFPTTPSPTSSPTYSSGLYTKQTGGDSGRWTCSKKMPKFLGSKIYFSGIPDMACEEKCDQMPKCDAIFVRRKKCFWMDSENANCDPMPVNGTKDAYYTAYYVRTGDRPNTAYPTTPMPTFKPTTAFPTASPTRAAGKYTKIANKRCSSVEGRISGMKGNAVACQNKCDLIDDCHFLYKNANSYCSFFKDPCPLVNTTNKKYSYYERSEFTEAPTAEPTSEPTTGSPTDTPTTGTPTDTPTTGAPTDTPTTGTPTDAPTDASSQATTDAPTSEDSGLSGGAVGGIAVGAIAGVAIIAIGANFLMKKGSYSADADVSAKETELTVDSAKNGANSKSPAVPAV